MFRGRDRDRRRVSRPNAVGAHEHVSSVLLRLLLLRGRGRAGEGPRSGFSSEALRNIWQSRNFAVAIGTNALAKLLRLLAGNQAVDHKIIFWLD